MNFKKLFGLKRSDAGSGERTAKKTILVVDDDPDVVKYETFILEDAGFNVLAAEKGGEGLKIARNQLPDMILLDIDLPTLGGFQFCRMLKENPKTSHIPVIMVSGLDKMEDYLRSAREGAEAFVGKPIDRAELLNKIKIHLP
ncbi:MAG: response regulator [PVC group bacterium]